MFVDVMRDAYEIICSERAFEKSGAEIGAIVLTLIDNDV